MDILTNMMKIGSSIGGMFGSVHGNTGIKNYKVVMKYLYMYCNILRH